MARESQGHTAYLWNDKQADLAGMQNSQSSVVGDRCK